MTENVSRYFQYLEQQSGGTLGISALHLESGQNVQYKSDEMFLLCSTYKIPIAICLLEKIDHQLIDLNQLIVVHEYDLRPGSGSFLLELDYSSEVKLSLINLLKLMMQYSCNTSTDIILKLIKGTQSVMNMLHRLNIENLHVDTTTLQAIAYWDGIIKLPADGKLTLSEYKSLASAVDPITREKCRESMSHDKKDCGSPNGMTQLLKKLLESKIVQQPSVHLLLEIMRRCKTAPNRMMGKLPSNVVVSRKTGTLPGFINEVGIMQLPFNQGHLLVSIYIKNAEQSLSDCENIIAETARFIFDYFIFKQN